MGDSNSSPHFEKKNSLRILKTSNSMKRPTGIDVILKRRKTDCTIDFYYLTVPAVVQIHISQTNINVFKLPSLL